MSRQCLLVAEHNWNQEGKEVCRNCLEWLTSGDTEQKRKRERMNLRDKQKYLFYIIFFN